MSRCARAISTTSVDFSWKRNLFTLRAYEREYHWLYVRKIGQISIMHGCLYNLFVLVLYACKSSLMQARKSYGSTVAIRP